MATGAAKVDQEFEEAEFFPDEDDASSGAPASHTKELLDSEAEDAFPAFEGNGSAASTTLNVEVVADDRFCDEKRIQFRGMACSLPVSAGIKMGSSVPMNIPFKMVQQALPGMAGPAAIAYPATFVPPHQLSQREDFTFSFTGESPAVGIKRDKLRARNAILKSTGFLEKSGAGAGSPSRSSMDKGSLTKSMVGGLSQALHAAGSPR
ncbi:predicted protein [Haematococcus lacustris]|uniref:Uncharacterized protein n=1 Tax=Haematococcus lacustris TaxID=44745 RepID=A0A699ZD07_HAELA|nr:hypothetical protein QJQ45_024169 [Haematococcus lacustris]GFH20493.1 predicted protein [Haematococcus lacustris]